MYDHARYAKQSDSQLVHGLLAALLQDGVTMTALGWRLRHDQAPLGVAWLEPGISIEK